MWRPLAACRTAVSARSIGIGACRRSPAAAAFCTAHARLYSAADRDRDASYLQRQAAPAAAAASALPFREREREHTPAPTPASSALAAAAPSAELKAEQDAAMDRATRKARLAARNRRRTHTRRSAEPAPWVPPPPLYHPAPFASLPVIPCPKETLQSALIRVDKVPKSPGFGKEIGRVRGQMAKYNFVARRQLEVATLELATKLEQRLDLFPRIPLADANDALPTRPDDPNAQQAAQLHPFDASLLTCSLEGGAREYATMLNHGRNLVGKIRGAHKAGLQALNHSKSIWESRAEHRKAIFRMKDLWKAGVPASEATGGAEQPSALDLVERLRKTSQLLRHLPSVEFRRNLLDARDDVASYLSVLPQEVFRLPASELTFAKLRPYLPPSPSYTLALLGAPNVGKSSLLSSLSRAKVEVAPFAFTTLTLQMGHMERDEQQAPSWVHESLKAKKKAAREAAYALPLYTPSVPLTRVQLLDTPGLLFRPDSMRKSVEQLALAATRHINPLMCAFVLDATGSSGMTVRLQRFLRRELKQRCRTHEAPHPRASETDPNNRVPRDPLYANVAADAQLQSLQRRLQSIPWIDIASKADVRKKEFVADEVLRRGEPQGQKDVRTVEQEIADANQDEQPEPEVEQPVTESTETALAIAAPRPPPMDRATWKLNEIRAHMHRYLCDASGRIVLDDEAEGVLPLLLPQHAGEDVAAAPVAAPAAVMPVSTESGSGLAALQARIWHEVDQRESLRLEAAYTEMRARILWMRGESMRPLATDAQQIQADQARLIEQ